MTPKQRANLKRLLAPRSIAVIGGGEAASSASFSRALGFVGPVWGVNPKRNELGGEPCFASVADLPEAPDAVFLAIPRSGVIDTLRELDAIGAGGAVCYTAGFRELGGEGAKLEQALIEAAGDLAVVGPNCFGLLAPISGAALWPYDHGAVPVERGVALVMQSGMLASNMTMNRRALPLAYVISAGNQSVLGIEDYLDVLVDDPAVTGIGLYIEELRDIPKFADASLRAVKAGIPVVALKAGKSEIAASLAVTHTGSLSGSDEVYQALFDRLGVIRAASPVMMVEILKMISLAGVPQGRRLAAFTGSGGDAAMLADLGETCGLEFAQPDESLAGELRAQLPDIATVSNPLDYTTELWGKPEEMERLVATMLTGSYDAAMIVQDYPVTAPDADRSYYENDTTAFIQATRNANVPGAVCVDLPENLDRPARERIVEGGAAPLQGLEEAMTAIASACWFGERRAAIAASPPGDLLPVATSAGVRTLDEWDGKTLLAEAGLPVPEGRLVRLADVDAAANELGYPVALKMVDAKLAHKSEIGAVRLGLETPDAVEAAAAGMATIAADLGIAEPRFLVERMVDGAVAEVLVGLRRDERFGGVLVVGSGGVLVELIGDTRTLLLPASLEDNLRGAFRSESLKSDQRFPG